MISFVETVGPLEDTMGVDIRLGAPLHSRPSNPNFFPLAVNRVSRPRRSRSTPTARADSTRNSADFDVGSILQISKLLYVLHQCAKLVHANLMPWTVLIIAAVSLSSACIVTRDLILTLG